MNICALPTREQNRHVYEKKTSDKIAEKDDDRVLFGDLRTGPSTYYSGIWHIVVNTFCRSWTTEIVPKKFVRNKNDDTAMSGSLSFDLCCFTLLLPKNVFNGSNDFLVTSHSHAHNLNELDAFHSSTHQRHDGSRALIHEIPLAASPHRLHWGQRDAFVFACV